jgi:redox-sensitive bicupin YhaK (pirin superfamily)
MNGAAYLGLVPGERSGEDKIMIEIRPFSTLGAADHGWLKARHHFAFGHYADAKRQGWGSLRVWNDDTIAAGAGFPMHPHADMEIITYVRSGAITHEDSLGNKGRTEAGDVQVMSAGTGVRHSEFNLEDATTTLFQIWIIPSARGGAPMWGAKPFPRENREGRFVVLASGASDDAEALPIRADARVLGATLAAGKTLAYDLDATRYGYLVPARGSVTVNGQRLETRDAAAIHGETHLTIVANDEAELVFVDAAA